MKRLTLSLAIIGTIALHTHPSLAQDNPKWAEVIGRSVTDLQTIFPSTTKCTIGRIPIMPAEGFPSPGAPLDLNPFEVDYLALEDGVLSDELSTRQRKPITLVDGVTTGRCSPGHTAERRDFHSPGFGPSLSSPTYRITALENRIASLRILFQYDMASYDVRDQLLNDGDVFVTSNATELSKSSLEKIWTLVGKDGFLRVIGETRRCRDGCRLVVKRIGDVWRVATYNEAGGGWFKEPTRSLSAVFYFSAPLSAAISTAYKHAHQEAVRIVERQQAEAAARKADANRRVLNPADPGRY